MIDTEDLKQYIITWQEIMNNYQLEKLNTIGILKKYKMILIYLLYNIDIQIYGNSNLIFFLLMLMVDLPVALVRLLQIICHLMVQMLM